MTRAINVTLLATLIVLVFGAASCTSDADTTDSQSSDRLDSDGRDSAGTTSEGANSTPPTSTADDGTTPSGNRRTKTCQKLEELDDGRYQAGDAGTIVVSRDGDNLTVEDIEAADGWTVSVDDDDDPDEVEVDLRSGSGKHVEFEAEVDDGRMEIEVCTIG